MFCRECGSEIKEGSLFCSNCGNTIKNVKKINNKKNKVMIKIAIGTIVLIIILFAIGIIIHNNLDKKNRNLTTQEKNNSINEDKEEDNIETENLLEQIYQKYPTLKGTEGIVCYDEDNYWLLNKEGKKVYFYDLDTFESALIECDKNINNINDNKQNQSTNTSNRQVSEAEIQYDKITKGMSYYQVIGILGKPRSSTNSGGAKNCIWIISNEVICVQFINDVVYQKVFNENNSSPVKELDPETTHSIHYNVGFPPEDYIKDLDEWGIKYQIIKEENLNYDNNVVTKIEPNNCKIDKNTVVKLTVSDNTYNMGVMIDAYYLIQLAGITDKYYNSEYDMEKGRYVGDKIQLMLKINGKTIFNGQTESLGINHALRLGEIKGKPTDEYTVEATIEGITITKKINYVIMGDKAYKSFLIYEGGTIGGG